MTRASHRGIGAAGFVAWFMLIVSYLLMVPVLTFALIGSGNVMWWVAAGALGVTSGMYTIALAILHVGAHR